MLRHLRVGNLAVAADVSLDFGPGLTMLTGETGAGKSLIAGAMALLAGGKADKDAVRQGEDLAFVEGVFDLTAQPDLREDIAQAGLRLAEDGILVLRREIRREGRGRVLINGLLSSLALLEDFGGRLLAVQSQDQQRELMRPHFALDFLDRVLDLEPLRARVGRELATWRASVRELEARRQEADFARQQLEMWEYQHRELSEAALDPTEEAALREQLALGRGARGLLEAVAGARDELVDGEPSAVELLGSAAARLAHAAEASPRLAEIHQQLVAAQDLAGEAARDLERFLTGVEVDPARLDELETRQSLYDELARKYGRDTAGLLEFQEDLGERIARHQAADDELTALTERCAADQVALGEVCADIRRRRREGAVGVARRAEELIRPLALPDLEMSFEILPDLDDNGSPVDGESCRITARGADSARLIIRTNPGEAAGELSRTASGGERSRLYLGLTVLARRSQHETPLQLFDEVDAGLGMDHAVAVAGLLSEVAADSQVLCITHMPTVAALGHRHLRVVKRTRDGRTDLVVEEVRGEERVTEVARLLGGEKAGDPVRQSDYARELLRQQAAGSGSA